MSEEPPEYSLGELQLLSRIRTLEVALEQREVVLEMWRHKFEAAERQMAAERADNARLREAGGYLAKCMRLTSPAPDSWADLILQRWVAACVPAA